MIINKDSIGHVGHVSVFLQSISINASIYFVLRGHVNRSKLHIFHRNCCLSSGRQECFLFYQMKKQDLVGAINILHPYPN